MRRFFNSVVFAIWHFVAYSRPSEKNPFVDVQRQLMKEQRARHKLIEALR